MPADSTADDALLRGEADLFEAFEGAYRATPRLVGVESEKVAVFTDGAPLRYRAAGGHPGVEDLLPRFVERFGWTPEVDKPGAPVLMLTRGRENITLEPGSQFELSGSPHASLHALRDELARHRDEVVAIGDEVGLRFLALGFHPLARQEDLDWVPKPRYPIMRDYLPTRGLAAHDMMRRTATAQVNFDVSSEADAMRKLRAALALSPVVTALFANSAVVEGQRGAFKSRRARVWLEMDPDRTGMLPFAWKAGASLGDYVRWALDAPMFIVKRGSEVTRATHLTFRRYMAEGLGEHRATRGDWEVHIKTLFPEVRLGRTFEVRGADSVPLDYAAALAALWTGLLYDDDALAAVEDRLVPLGCDAWTEVRPAAGVDGLAARVRGTPLREYAATALDLARRSLARRGITDDLGRDESVLLDPLAPLVERGLSVGDAVLGDWSASMDDAVTALLDRARF